MPNFSLQYTYYSNTVTMSIYLEYNYLYILILCGILILPRFWVFFFFNCDGWFYSFHIELWTTKAFLWQIQPTPIKYWLYQCCTSADLFYSFSQNSLAIFSPFTLLFVLSPASIQNHFSNFCSNKWVNLKNYCT